MEQTAEQRVAERLGFKIEFRNDNNVCSYVIDEGKDYSHIEASHAVALWRELVRMEEENAGNRGTSSNQVYAGSAMPDTRASLEKEKSMKPRKSIYEVSIRVSPLSNDIVWVTARNFDEAVKKAQNHADKWDGDVEIRSIVHRGESAD